MPRAGVRRNLWIARIELLPERNGTEVADNAGSSMVVFLMVPLCVSVFSVCLFSMPVFLFPLTSRVGAHDLTRTWPVVDLSHICTCTQTLSCLRAPIFMSSSKISLRNDWLVLGVLSIATFLLSSGRLVRPRAEAR